MAKTVFYKQCKLEKQVEGGSCHQTSYIPEEFAVVGKVLKLREEGVWDNGWKVTFASSKRYETHDLPDSHQQIKGHRKNTGDSLPKEKKVL
jgi:hypothetical protein